MKTLPGFLALSGLFLGTAGHVVAQSGEQRVTIAIGGIAYEGKRGEAGVGIAAAGRLSIARSARYQFGLEIGVQTLFPIGQVCTLGIPGSCSPEDPASPVGHVRVLAGRPITRSGAVYSTLGVGAYGPVGRSDEPNSLAFGWDIRLGVRFSQRVDLETGYLQLRTRRVVGGAVPISLLFRL